MARRRRALKRTTGIDGAGAILTRGNAQVDPYRAVPRPRAAARAAGARLFEHSRSRRMRAVVDRRPRSSSIAAASRARRSIVATGYATPEFKPLAGRFRMFNTYVVATPRALATRAPTAWTWRRDAVGHRAAVSLRAVDAGPSAALRRSRSAAASGRASARTPLDAAQARCSTISRRLYPALADVEPDYAWEGLFATTPDGLPYIGTHRRYPRHLFALGYGGNGMTFGFLAAQMLDRAIRGRPTETDAIFGFNRLGKHHSRQYSVVSRQSQS